MSNLIPLEEIELNTGVEVQGPGPKQESQRSTHWGRTRQKVQIHHNVALGRIEITKPGVTVRPTVYVPWSQVKVAVPLDEAAEKVRQSSAANKPA